MKLPDALQKRLGDFGKALLNEVQASESSVRDVERANFEVERTAYRDMLDEAVMTVDVLEARVEALTTEVVRLRKGGATEVVERSVEDEAEVLRRVAEVQARYLRGETVEADPELDEDEDAATHA